MKLKNKAQIETWLEQGELGEVIGELKKQLKASRTSKALYSDALVLSAQLKKINADKIDRVVSYEHETLALNNLRRNLLDFIEMVENHEGTKEEAAPVFAPKKEEKKEERKGGFGWWWLLVPLAGVGIWLLFFQNKSKAIINICTLTQISNQGHCCSEDLPRISLNESNGYIYATTVIPDDYGGDPIIQGVVFWETGVTFPVQPIKFEYDITNNDLCHSAIIHPANGTNWSLGKYTLQLQLNGQIAGEKTFEIIR